MRFGWLAIVLVGCGSSFGQVEGSGFQVDLPVEGLYWADADDDGWGDPDTEPEILVGADASRGITATNGLDCDDGDDAITGKVGSACPEQLLPAIDGFVGAVGAEGEYVAVYGDSPRVGYDEIDGVCAMWGEGGAAVPGSIDGVDLTEALDGVLPNGEYAAFVGISYQDGSWRWLDGSKVSGSIGFCGGEPDPEDFFPLLDSDNSAHDELIAAVEASARLALIRRSNGSWCYGVPDVGDYEDARAHFVCQRATPDPEDFVVYLDAEDDTEG